MITTDIFLKMGKSHQICEDYIITGNNPFNYIILSDGCSSSKHTDMGARILCHLAKQYILYRQADEGSMFPALNYEVMGLWIIHNAELTARQLGLPQSCLNATLIVAFEYEGRYRVYMYGDGSIITMDNADMPKCTTIDFTENAPYYLTYRINPENMQEYHNLAQQAILREKVVEFPEHRLEYAYDYPFYFEYPVDQYKKLLICSDGINSFQVNSQVIENIMPFAIEFMAYKSTTGEFLKRRLKRAIKLYEADDICHMDDLSVGAFINEDN